MELCDDHEIRRKMTTAKSHLHIYRQPHIAAIMLENTRKGRALEINYNLINSSTDLLFALRDETGDICQNV